MGDVGDITENVEVCCWGCITWCRTLSRRWNWCLTFFASLPGSCLMADLVVDVVDFAEADDATRFLEPAFGFAVVSIV